MQTWNDNPEEIIMNSNKKLRLIETAIKAAKEFEQQGKIQESVDEYLRAAELLKTVKGNEK